MKSLLIRRHVLSILCVIVLAIVVGVIATWNGVSYWGDGAWYLTYARNIREGHGLSVPISDSNTPEVRSWIIQWPPLFPIWLALVPDTLGWARVSSILTLMLSSALMLVLGIKLLPGNRWLPVIAVFLFLSIPTVTSEVFALVWAETLFVPMGLAVLLLMMNYRLRVPQPSMRPALIAAAITALALLTRYVGVAYGVIFFVYSVAWALTVRQPRRWQPAIAFLLSFLPLGLYTLYLHEMTGRLTGWQKATDSLSLADIPNSLRLITLQLLHGIDFPLQYLLGLQTNWVALLIGAALAVPVLWQLWRKRAFLATTLTNDHLITLVYVLGYLVVFWLLSVRSNTVIADWRHYVVIYPALILLLSALVRHAQIPRWVVVALLTLYGISGFYHLQETSRGLKFYAPQFRSDPILRDLAAIIPPDSVIMTQSVSLAALWMPNHRIEAFGGLVVLDEFACDYPQLPPDTRTVSFLLVEDSMALRQYSKAEREAIWRAWAAPCGTVKYIDSTDLALIMVIDWQP